MPRLSCLFLLLCSSLALGAERWPSPEWPVQLADGAAAQALQAYAFPRRDDATRSGIRSDALLVVRDGVIVHEAYAGATEASTPHLIWSASKSLFACVLARAADQGLLQLDDPLARHYAPMQKHPQVRIRDVLNWASGLDWQEEYEFAPLRSSVVAMLYTRGRADMGAFAADHPRLHGPGTHFRYSSGDSNLLAALLRERLGERHADYPWQALFEPLGISSAVWERDASGSFIASSYVYLTARDLARVGLLMQRDGRWGEAQLLPAEWVDFMRTPFVGEGLHAGGGVPGGHWWLNRVSAGQPAPWPDAPQDTFAALGHWGQGLYVMPSEGLVVVRYADDREPGFDSNRLLALVRAAYGREARP